MTEMDREWELDQEAAREDAGLYPGAGAAALNPTVVTQDNVQEEKEDSNDVG